MLGLDALVGVLACAIAGVGLGFVAGLVPGLHMNNISAALVSSTAFVGAFSLAGRVDVELTGLLASCFISSAVLAHIFAESVSSAYVGIPAGDVVSVLPAHRLAKAGMGSLAVRVAADGALAGVLLSCAFFFPLCLIMGEPGRLYSILGMAMGVLVIVFSAILILSEAWPTLKPRAMTRGALRKVLKASCVFLISGTLGIIVLQTQFCSSDLPDFPWMPAYTSKSSLLLPMFAGLFGVPSLLLSLGSRRTMDNAWTDRGGTAHHPSLKDLLLSVMGGAIVGWLPGMTSGSAATICAPGMRDDSETSAIGEATRFIWLYSSISASGAVFAVGALFVILRARSGSMDAVKQFLSSDLVAPWEENAFLISAILLSLLISALLSHTMLVALNPHFAKLQRALCSRWLAVVSLVFVCALSSALTGTRGLLVMAAAVVLGLLPPLTGTRRIQLMGCLLVPIAILLSLF